MITGLSQNLFVNEEMEKVVFTMGENGDVNQVNLKP